MKSKGKFGEQDFSKSGCIRSLPKKAERSLEWHRRGGGPRRSAPKEKGDYHPQEPIAYSTSEGRKG